MKKSSFLLSLALMLGLICSKGLASKAVDPNDIDSWNPDYTGANPVSWHAPQQSGQYLSIKPNLNIWGFVGKRGVAKLQGMLPFGGDGTESIFYGAVDAAASYSRTTGRSVGAAVGYRGTFDGSYILGAYSFFDFNSSPRGNTFWTVNPGVEVLNNVWDLRVNGYIPSGSKKWFGEEFMGLQQYEETNCGVDGEIGRLVPIKRLEGLKVFVGGYHFFMKDSDAISGVDGRLFYPLLNYVAFETRYSYDKVMKNTLMFGIRLTAGGFNSDDKKALGIAARLNEPVEHSFANFASGNTVPVRDSWPVEK